MAKRYHEDKKMMKRASEMINDDHSAPCMLPQHVIEKYWPVAHNYEMHAVSDDLFKGVQKQMHEDYKDLGREMSPKKY